MTIKQQLILSLAIPVKYHAKIRKAAHQVRLLPHEYIKLLWRLK